MTDVELLRRLRAVAWPIWERAALPALDLSDLVHAGWLGFARALPRAEGRNGARPDTFAMCCARGAMLEEVRRWRGNRCPSGRRGVPAYVRVEQWTVAQWETVPDAPDEEANATSAGMSSPIDLSGLYPREREAVELSVLDGLPIAAVAERMGCAVMTAYGARWRGLRRLRAAVAA